MAMEIELKARVVDCETLKAILCEKADYSGAFEKHDTYWYAAPPFPAAFSLMRVRRENRSLPGESTQSVVFATHKIKQVKDGIEINEEREFEVKPGQEFEAFLEGLGFAPCAFKKKAGLGFFA